MRRNSSHGNAALEMVVFTPLAFLVLFAGTDFGLQLVSRGRIVSAARAAINAELDFAGQDGLLDVADERVDEDAVRRVAHHTASVLYERLREAAGERDADRIAVRVLPFIARFDAESGAALGAPRMLARADVTFGVVKLPDRFEVEHPTKYVARTLEGRVDALREPLGMHYRSPRASGGSERYLQNRVFFYVEARALPRGLFPAVSEALLGSPFGVYERQIHTLRFQLS